MQGIAEGLDIEGSGKVQYALTDQNSSQAILQCDAYLVPKLHPNLRLISPQGIKTNKGDKATFTIHMLDEAKNDPTLEIKPNGPDWINAKPIHVIPVKFDPRSNLPVALARLPEDNHYGEFSFCAPSQSQESESKLNATVCLTEEANANLTSSQKELLRWHYKLGHVSFRQIQWLIRNKKLSTIGSYKAVANCTIPKCASCEFGKASRRPTRATKTQSKEDKELSLKKDHLYPGQQVSTDHFVSAVPGRTYSSRGSSRANTFCGGSIFVDHTTGYVDV